MPSDAKKKQQQKKKEAAKARQSGKKPQSNNQTKAAEDGKEQSPTLGDLQNGTNGTAISTEGIYIYRVYHYSCFVGRVCILFVCYLYLHIFLYYLNS